MDYYDSTLQNAEDTELDNDFIMGSSPPSPGTSWQRETANFPDHAEESSIAEEANMEVDQDGHHHFNRNAPQRSISPGFRDSNQDKVDPQSDSEEKGILTDGEELDVGWHKQTPKRSGGKSNKTGPPKSKRKQPPTPPGNSVRKRSRRKQGGNGLVSIPLTDEESQALPELELKEQQSLLKPVSGLGSKETSRILAAVSKLSEEELKAFLNISHEKMVEGFKKMTKDI